MSQDISAVIADHPIMNSDEGRQYHQFNNPTTDTTMEEEVRNNSNINPGESVQMSENFIATGNDLVPPASFQNSTLTKESLDIHKARGSINDTTTNSAGKVNAEVPNSVVPPTSIVQPPENIDTQSRHSITQQSTQHLLSPTTSKNTSLTATSSHTQRSEKMRLFGRRQPIPRRQVPHSSAVTTYEADLTSKDRATQKEAVRKYLEERVKKDWKWDWPQNDSDHTDPADTADSPVSDVATDDSPNTEEPETALEEVWKERDEWESNFSGSDEDTIPKGPININAPEKENPFRFDSPDGVGDRLAERNVERKRRRKSRLAEEISWNDGARCFAERRDAWTCARRVPPTSRRVSRIKSADNTGSQGEGSSTAAEDEEVSDEEWDTEVPIAGPLLPPDNAMRASIQPDAYGMIYDKVILQSLTPSCPMNLADVTRSCVQGWKRDGEWPPRSNLTEPGLAKRKQRRMSLANILGLDKTPTHDDKAQNTEKAPASPSSIRKGFQKIWGFGHDGTGKKTT